MKKAVICFCLAFLLVILATPLVLAAETSGTGFRDVDPTTDVGKAISKMQGKQYVNGYADGTFHPGGFITRAELAKLVNAVFNYTEQKTVVFSDVNSTQWFYSPVAIAKTAGYLFGFPDGSFRPNANVTRQEMCVILNRIMNFAPLPFETVVMDSIDSWAKDDVMTVLSNRVFLVKEDGIFGATQPITRGEVCLGLAQFITGTVTEEPTQASSGTNSQDQENSNVFKAMQRVVSDLEKYVLNPPAPQSISAEEKEIVLSIIKNMKACLADSTYDYKPGAEDTYQKYLTLNKEQQDNLRYLIAYYSDTSDLLLLKDFFF